MDRDVQFVGGPLDGRRQSLADSEAVEGRLLKHVHLHGGPKIETHYVLRHDHHRGWEYHVLGAG